MTACNSIICYVLTQIQHLCLTKFQLYITYTTSINRLQFTIQIYSGSLTLFKHVSENMFYILYVPNDARCYILLLQTLIILCLNQSINFLLLNILIPFNTTFCLVSPRNVPILIRRHKFCSFNFNILEMNSVNPIDTLIGL